jgi:hypothetical protein
MEAFMTHETVKLYSAALFDDVLPQVPVQPGRREFDAERWARELEATTKRPEDKSFIRQVARALGFGKRRLDS